LVRATFGFGEAVVSMPLLALLPIPLDTAIALVGLAGLTFAVLAVASGWRHVDLAAMKRLVPATILGVPVRLLLVTFAPARIITGFLGGFLVVYGVFSLARPAETALRNPQWALPFGFAAGVLGSAYNFNGIPVVVYAGFRGWNPSRFRGTLQAHFLVSGIVIVTGQALAGLWSHELVTDYVFALPTIVIATALGTVLHKRIPAEKFAASVYALVIALGVVLLARAL